MTPRASSLAATPKHPVRLVAERTGLSPHVLRVWERRYGVVAPSRSAGGQRLYSDEELHRLDLMARLARNGRAVSAIAQLGVAALERLVTEDARGIAGRERPAGEHHDRAMAAIRDMDSAVLAQSLRRALLSLGTPAFLAEVVGPLVTDIGDEWHAGRLTVAHEHAATAVIEQVLAWIVREFSVGPDAPRVVLATPTGERHVVGAMIAAAAAAHEQWHVVWLGADLPAAQIVAAARRHEVRAVGLSIVARSAATASAIKSVRRELAADVPLLVGGAASDAARRIDGVTTVKDLAHWRALLRRHAPASAA